MKKDPLFQSTTEQVAKACSEESQQTRQQEQGSCFELFCRAFDEQDDVAWEAIQTQYHKLVRQWLHAYHTSFLTIDVEEDLIQETLHHFWRTLNKQPQKIRTRFPHVGALLNYLRQCAQSAVIGRQRREQKQLLIQEKLAQFAKEDANAQLAAWEQAEEAQQQYQSIQVFIEKRISDTRERKLLELTYRLGLKPQEIVIRYPEEFASVKDVQRVKERVLKRMRRALN